MEQILLSIRTIISQTPLKLKKFNLKKKKKNLRSSLLTWLDYVPPSKKRNYLRKRGSAITSLPLLSIGNPDSQSSGIPRWFETSFHSKGHACNTEARDKKRGMESKWMESAWNEGVVLVADIHFPALLNAHPPFLDPRRKRRGTKHGTMSRNLPSSLPYPFLCLSLLKHRLYFSWPLSLPGIQSEQRERSSRYLLKKSTERASKLSFGSFHSRRGEKCTQA